MIIKNNNIFKTLFVLSALIVLLSCNDSKTKTNDTNSTTVEKETYPSDVISFFDHFKLILGDGTNVGVATEFKNDLFFYTTNENDTDWVVFKTPNNGSTHGSSNNTRTELAQKKKFFPSKADDKMNATLKVMNVSATGDARVAASYSVVVGQIHSADGHENEPLKIFYKKFPGHEKGSVFWNYEINTAGDDNAGRWDYSTPVWGYDLSIIGVDKETAPAEPEDGIKLGEEFSYEVHVKDGIMSLNFSSEGHETKTFTKNLLVSEFSTVADRPAQVEKLFIPIGQDGVERKEAYTGEGCFFKIGTYNQTNGKSPEDNIVWCAGAETHGGDIEKQYADGNFAEVWFKSASVMVSDEAVSNEEYFSKNDDYKK